jgi:hypothetical protein
MAYSTCQFNAVGASGFNETIKLLLFFKVIIKKDDSSTELEYSASDDQAQGTDFIG